MRDVLVPSAAWLPATHSRVLDPVERRPIGTNGYVSTWGALTGLCPPKGR
ncbi:hypothetical protein [Streptomyces xiamenensis]